MDVKLSSHLEKSISCCKKWLESQIPRFVRQNQLSYWKRFFSGLYVGQWPWADVLHCAVDIYAKQPYSVLAPWLWSHGTSYSTSSSLSLLLILCFRFLFLFTSYSYSSSVSAYSSSFSSTKLSAQHGHTIDPHRTGVTHRAEHCPASALCCAHSISGRINALEPDCFARPSNRRLACGAPHNGLSRCAEFLPKKPRILRALQRQMLAAIPRS